MPRQVTHFSVPYDMGRLGVGSGLGSRLLCQEGVGDRLAAATGTPRQRVVELEEALHHEVGTIFAVNQALAQGVARTIQEGGFPVVVGGSCNSCLGALAGCGGGVGVVWLDAHGDFNTPETTASGYFDGMPLAAAAGLCWKKLCLELPGFEPVDPANILMVGARDLDPPEEELLVASGVKLVGADGFAAAASALAQRVEAIYLHVDLDVLDPRIAIANRYTAPGGLSLEDVAAVLARSGELFQVRCAALCSFDPAYDPQGKALAAALSVGSLLGQLA